MTIGDYLLGIDHIGIPTDDIKKTMDFYTGLGFNVDLFTTNENNGAKVAFMKLNNLVIETYESAVGLNKDAAIDHVAIGTSDIEKVFERIKEADYKMLSDEIQCLGYFENGVRFFAIEGPNFEKVAFFQRL